MHACISSCITSMVSKQFFSFFFSSLLLITSLFLFLFFCSAFIIILYFLILISYLFFFFFFNTFQRTSISILYFIILHLKCILILYTREKMYVSFIISYLYNNLLFIRQVRNYLPWIIFFFLQFSLYDEMEFSFSHNYFFFFTINDRDNS